MKPLSILLVEDDEIERLKFKKVCENVKFITNISIAYNGEKALDLLNNDKNSFDLIISDLNMPRMNGFEFLTKLKSSEHKNIPIVIFSTSDNDIDLKKCYSLGIAGYFTKPIKHSDYIAKTTSLLEYWHKSENILF